MDLPRFIATVRARRWMILGIVVGAAGLALVWSLSQPSRYTAEANLLFGHTTSVESVITGGATGTGDIPDRTAATNLALASLDTVAANVQRGFKGSATVEELKNAVTVAAEGGSDVVKVTAKWDSPTGAATIANAFAAEIVRLRRDTERAGIQRAIDALTARVPSSTKTPAETAVSGELSGKIADLEALKQSADGNVTVVEHATPPDNRSSPKPLRNSVIAGFVALILAIFVAILLRRFDDRIGDEEELATIIGAPILARIPEVERSRRAKHIWSPKQDAAFLESFEFLRLNLQLLAHNNDAQVVAVTSPTASEGKSTVVGWLARSLALSGAEVLAVDLDLRNPELHSYLNTPRAPDSDALDALIASGDDDDSGQRRLRDDGDDGVPRAAPGNDETQPSGRRVYTEEDITASLVELARASGNARHAIRSLRLTGRDIPESTLRGWKWLHADRYDEIRATHRKGTVVAPHLRVLTGTRHELASGLMTRERLHRLFDGLRENTDFIIVDTVPVSTVADASAVAAAADGVILVLDIDRVRRRELMTAKRQLANVRARIIGIVINRSAGDFPVYYAPLVDQVPESGTPGDVPNVVN